MNIKLLQVGKTTDSYLREGITLYESRLKNYISYETITLPELKKTSSLSQEVQKIQEGKIILDSFPPQCYVVLLDEKGHEFSSVEFSGFIQKQLLKSLKSLIFVIGGPYGFSEEVYKRADFKISLSRMTYSHQMVRILFTEQLYRAFTILKNEPYHH